jgi:hypothetical protein
VVLESVKTVYSKEVSGVSLSSEIVRARNEYQFMLIGISNAIEAIIAIAFIPGLVFIALIMSNL